MKRLIVVAFALALAACAITPKAAVSTAARAADTIGAPAPANLADQTTLDEGALLRLERIYKAIRTAAEMAVDTGMIRGAMATRIADADNFAFGKLRLARAAYDTGNAASYTQALREAEPAIAAIWGN